MSSGGICMGKHLAAVLYCHLLCACAPDIDGWGREVWFWCKLQSYPQLVN
jgi:hypothetical protein